ncbi:unnamed protein product, partial [Didymodactylos carnosus]
MASSNFSNESITVTPAAAVAATETGKTNDDDVQRVGNELMQSELAIPQLPVIIQIRDSYASLQSSLEPLMANDPVLNQLNRNASGDIENLMNIIEIARDMRGTAADLDPHLRNVPPQVIEKVNTRGQRMNTNIFNMVHRIVENIQQNLAVLEKAVSENAKTKSDPEIKQLLHKQRDITNNIAPDPRQAYGQLQLADEIGGRLLEQIGKVESNANAPVIVTGQQNSKYLKLAVNLVLVCAAVLVVVCISGGVILTANVGFALGATAFIAARDN